ncbi:MAG: Ig-like domain-containing protein, partial [Nitrospirae bacterium]|nr:Ig-like domain-containing protein [Nitrospirota bacterium]
MSFRLRHTKRHLCLTLCTALLTVFAVIPSFPVDVPAQTGNLFGPESFARTTGPTNVYTRAFTVPSDVAAPYSLHIQNGQPDGRNRISSGTVSINGVEIIHKSDFSQTVSTIDRSVTLGSTNTLTVTLNSKPNSFIIVTILGIVVEPPPNQPPAARAGSDQTVSIGTEGGLITYAWSFIEKPPGSLAELSDPASVQPHFTADHEGIYRLGLIVNDGLADSPPDEVIITAYHPNTPPTANAGPDQNVLTGTTVQLNGTGSIDPEGDVLTYHWTITQSPAGSTAQLTDTVSPAPSFVADLDGEYHVQLVVNDGQADSAPDEAIIIATTPNRAPTADAGPDQTVSKGTPVHLNGNASFDPDGDPLTYQWSLVSKPAGSSSALDDPTLATPSFPADKGGEYVFHLTVSDGELTGAADAVVVVSVNHLPIANAGSDQTVRVGTRVVLEGGGSSDPDGDVLTFNWNIIARPVNSGATLTAPTSANPNLTPDIEGVYTLQLIVNDGEADSAPDEVQITAENPSFTLSVTKTGTGAGYVSSLPVGVTCEPDCTEVYEKGTTVILTAHPNTGSAFFGFSGGCVSVTLTCSFTLTEDTTVMVSFSSLSNLTLSSITVTPVNPTITVGQAQSFTATGIFSDGSTRILTDGEVTWSSGNTTVATMDTTGPATGLRTGTSTITATAGHISGISTTTFPSPISAGIAYACTVLSDSTLNCWGYNTYGQLGNGATRSSTAPVTVTGITTATAISAGWTHTCAVLSDSTVKCWGYNGYGQLGDGTTTNSSIPVAVSGIATAIGVTTGESHTCALLADGTVKCWGYNGYGQLGSGTTYTSTPVLVEGVSNAVAIEAGNNHTCAVLSNNTVTCWGLNNYGQLGNGTTTNSFTPVSVTGITTATAISAGWTHTCAALSDSTLKCWGNNSSGQLGDGTTTNSSAPVTVTGITTATAVSVGWTHTCAALSDSTLNCWGYNGYGQLGNGTTTNSSTPVTVTGITTATAVSAGWAHTCAALSDSTLRCWGRNAEGQLGNGTTTNSSTPVTVTGITTAATDGTAASRISGSTTLTVNNPVPVLTTLSQSSAVAGTGSFTLTVNGTGFVAGSLVYFSEIALATTFINSTQLTAEVPAEAIGTVGTVPVAVINPSPGGGPSNALNFEVQNPAAVVLSISPTEAETGSLDLTLTVGGTNF